MSDVELMRWVRHNSDLLGNICKDYLESEAEAEDKLKKITGCNGGELLFRAFGLDPAEGKDLFKEKKQNIEHFMKLLKELKA